MSSTPPTQPSTDVVFGEVGGTIVLARRANAEEVAAVRDAVRTPTTWGELRSRLSEARLTEIGEGFGDDAEWPADDVLLADEPVPGWDDGDWPVAPVQAMLEWVPDEVRQLGSEVSTRLSGEHLELPPERIDQIVAAIQAAGYAMDRDDALPSGPHGADGLTGCGHRSGSSVSTS